MSDCKKASGSKGKGLGSASKPLFPNEKSFKGLVVRSMRFGCPMCTREFESYKRSLEHLKQHEEGNGAPCTECKGFYKSSTHMASHDKLSHKCGKCKSCFSKEQHLLCHEKVDHGDVAVFPCRHCSTIFLKAKWRDCHTEECKSGQTVFDWSQHFGRSKVAEFFPQADTMKDDAVSLVSSVSTTSHRAKRQLIPVDTNSESERSEAHSSGRGSGDHTPFEDAKRVKRNPQDVQDKYSRSNQSVACPICEEDCHTAEGLVRHCARYHASPARRSGGSDQFPKSSDRRIVGARGRECPTCHGFWNSVEEFKHHPCLSSSTSHGGRFAALQGVKGVFQCEYCVKFFSSEVSKSLHYKDHIGTNMYQCGECPASYTAMEAISRHMDGTHSNSSGRSGLGGHKSVSRPSPKLTDGRGFRGGVLNHDDQASDDRSKEPKRGRPRSRDLRSDDDKASIRSRDREQWSGDVRRDRSRDSIYSRDDGSRDGFSPTRESMRSSESSREFQRDSGMRRPVRRSPERSADYPWHVDDEEVDQWGDQHETYRDKMGRGDGGRRWKDRSAGRLSHADPKGVGSDRGHFNVRGRGDARGKSVKGYPENEEDSRRGNESDGSYDKSLDLSRRSTGESSRQRERPRKRSDQPPPASSTQDTGRLVKCGVCSVYVAAGRAYQEHVKMHTRQMEQMMRGAADFE